MRTTVENLYRNANYSYSELVSLLIYGFIIGFIFSYNKWGINGIYNRSIGLQNLLLYTIASIFVIFLFTYLQKIIGVFVGVHTSSHITWLFLVISILLCFVTAGKIIIFIPPTLNIKQEEHLMIGRKPFALSIKNLRVFALLPILCLTLLGVLFSNVIPLAHPVSSALFWVCFLTALYSLIPVEILINVPLLFAKEKAEIVVADTMTHKVETRGASLGSILLFGSRMNLAFALVFLLCSLISQVTTGFIFTVLFSFFIALFATIVYFTKTELS